MPYTDDDIRQMTPEQRQSAIQMIEGELARRKGAGRFSLRGAALGGLRAFIGESPEKKPDEDLSTFMARERAKNIVNPPKYEPTTREEALAFEREKLGIKSEYDVAQQKFQKEQEEKVKANEIYSQNVKDSALDTLNAIDEVEKGIDYFGLTGGLPSIPGTERAKWEANVGKLLSGKVIDVMTKMKEASKTGATGFGQLSEKELKVLQEASTALKRTLSPKDARSILNDMKLKLKKIATYDATPQRGQEDFSQKSDDELRRIAAGG